MPWVVISHHEFQDRRPGYFQGAQPSYTLMHAINCVRGSDSLGASLSPTPLSLRFQSEILELPAPRRRSRYLTADSPRKRILLKQCPPLFRSRPDSPRRKSAGQQCLLTCRLPLPSPFQGYGTPALACSRTLSPPTMFSRASQAVCPEMNT